MTYLLFWLITAALALLAPIPLAEKLLRGNLAGKSFLPLAILGSPIFFALPFFAIYLAWNFFALVGVVDIPSFAASFSIGALTSAWAGSKWYHKLKENPRLAEKIPKLLP